MYPTTKELVEASTVAELTGLEPAQQDAVRDEAIIAVESYCRQSFEPEGTEEAPVTRTIDGAGSRELYLPRRLSSLSTLAVSDGSLSAADVVLSDQHDRLHVSEEAGGSTWATRALADAMGTRCAVFPAGSGTVEVAGVWGWADAEYPDAITTALRMDMEDRALAGQHALAETVRSARALGLGSVAQGGLTLDLSRGEPQVSVRVARILRGRTAAGEPYRWGGATGALA